MAKCYLQMQRAELRERNAEPRTRQSSIIISKPMIQLLLWKEASSLSPKTVHYADIFEKMVRKRSCLWHMQRCQRSMNKCLPILVNHGSGYLSSCACCFIMKWRDRYTTHRKIWNKILFQLKIAKMMSIPNFNIMLEPFMIVLLKMYFVVTIYCRINP